MDDSKDCVLLFSNISKIAQFLAKKETQVKIKTTFEGRSNGRTRSLDIFVR
jgi:hypothetical protein